MNVPVTVAHSEDPKLAAFAAEIMAVCRKHGMMLIPDQYTLEDIDSEGLKVLAFDEEVMENALYDALDERNEEESDEA